MGDLTYIQRDGEIQIVGQDATGNQVNYVSADINGNLLVKDYSDGPVTPGTAAGVSSLIGGQFNTTLPTLTNTQQSAIQLDSRGRVIVLDSNFPLVVDTNYGTVGASTIRTAAQIGNATDAADFNSGATTAQTLRVSSNLSDGAGTKISSELVNGLQRLSVTLSSAGTDGGPSPFGVNMSGGETPTNTIEPLQVDALGNTIVVGNVASGVADSGNPVKIGGVYNSSLPAFTNGQRGDIQLDKFGGIRTSNFFNYSHTNTAETVTLKSGAGLLHTLCINTAAAGGDTVIIYDNTAGSGTIIALFTTVKAVPQTMTYDVIFTTGLTIVRSGTTDVTISWR